MPLLFFPLYYQLLEAYHPSTYVPPTPISIVAEATPTPNPKVLGVKTVVTPSPLPPVGGDGKIITLALLGDSMIDTLKSNICQLSFQKYFPSIKFNLLDYGYGSTNIESALKRLTETTTYLGVENPSILSQNPDIILIESFAYNNFGNSQGGIDRQNQALNTLTNTIKKQLPNTKILLASTIAPNSITFGNGIKDIHFSALEKIEKSTTIKLYLQNLISFANKNNFALADAFHPSLFGSDGSSLLIDSNNNIHPSDLGTELFCDITAKSILDNELIN
jgi:hypothetical protein